MSPRRPVAGFTSQLASISLLAIHSARLLKVVAACTCLVLTPAASAEAPVYGFEVLATMPHDPGAFTQGLLFDRGQLLESTGGYGNSSLRRVRLEDGEVLAQVNLPPNLFGEGLALHGDYLYQLTWRSGTMLVYRRDDFSLLRRLRYSGEGWGIASAGERLVMSNGSDQLTWLNSDASAVLARTRVRDGNSPIRMLNELEWLPAAEGAPANADVDLLLANVWTTDRIAVIDPASGEVRSWIDLAGLLRGPFRMSPDSVLNGIAFDHDTRRLYVTGKRWPRLFEITTHALDGYLSVAAGEGSR